MSSFSSRSQRSSTSISPFRTRKFPKSAGSGGGGRPTTPTGQRLPRPAVSPTSTASSAFDRLDLSIPKENVTVTVRFRPLSAREITKGDGIAWYADGDYTVRNEYNPSIAYGFDRVFGPATTTRHVYDFAAQHVVNGAMQGINGTVFAYGVTSSGKTHTMHGEQKSPGTIPLAIKDVFGIIQETPGREFLLRVSYLEIYNEVINDLLDPTGQNLRIREDSQGTYVEGIKEEVVLSPAHALALIASGEEHRHVGSNNFNLLSSRSHTIFTLTVESSPSGENQGEEDVTLSQLNLIDLAGSESSKTETAGLRRKEGSYINKSLLTLGTVIAKLTDGKATHIPYRDSKLTRLLQSSLSGHGRVSLICTVTPASSNSEETHNTLKFAHRSKHVEIMASQNKILDEKSLIKKYQREISNLKLELQQLKQGILDKPNMSGQEDLVNLKLQLEAGQVKLQSRLEEEEQEKAALMGRIQRLTKLILVSSKNSLPSTIAERAAHRRRHSFGEDELVYLPDRKRDYLIDDDVDSVDSDISEGRFDNISPGSALKDDKKYHRRRMLGWFKLKKPELSISVDNESLASGSPASVSKVADIKDGRRKSLSKVGGKHAGADSYPERTQAGELFSATMKGRRPPPTGTTITDQMDLLQEQVKMLAGEVALCTSSLKRLSEQAATDPGDLLVQEQMTKLRCEINEKKLQLQTLEKRMIGSIEVGPHASNNSEISQALLKLTAQLNEMTFELEIKSADNRILQEQLQIKISENAEMQETVLLLRQQLSSRHKKISTDAKQYVDGSTFTLVGHDKWSDVRNPMEGTQMNGNSLLAEVSDSTLSSHVLVQASEIEKLKQENLRLVEEKDGLEIHRQKLVEEASYAKELAAAAAVELKSLAEEVTKLSHQNAQLTGDLVSAKERGFYRNNCSQLHATINGNQEDEVLIQDLLKEIVSRCKREDALETALIEKNQRVQELLLRVEEAKKREVELENELANMWVLVAKMRNSGHESLQISYDGDTLSVIPHTSLPKGIMPSNGICSGKVGTNGASIGLSDDNGFEQLKTCYEEERRRCQELETFVTKMKGADLAGLDMKALEELQSFHVEAITKICQAKCSSHAF